MKVRIAVVGDYNPAFHSHPATTEALKKAAAELGIEADVCWVGTATIPPAQPETVLSAYDAVLIAPGSPYVSFRGALAAIRFARGRDWPLFGA